jgi:hypothetical protein
VILDLSLDNDDNSKICLALVVLWFRCMGFLVVILDMSSTERLNGRERGRRPDSFLVSLIQYLILDFGHAFT